MKGKRRSLVVGFILLIVLSAAIGIALGKSEDYFDVEECKCTEFENTGIILDEQKSQASWGNELYCEYRDDNTGSVGYIDLIYHANETEFEEAFQGRKAVMVDYINRMETNDKVRIVEKRIVETDDYRLLSCLCYAENYQDPYYFGVREVFYRDQYYIHLGASQQNADFACDADLIQAYDEMERCAKEIVDNKEGRGYFINPLLVDEVVVGEELQLSVKSGTTTIENSEIKWEVPYHESINPNILPNTNKVGKIDRKGMFTAVNAGKCTVRATTGDKWVDKKITVKCCEEEQKGDIEDLKLLYVLRIPESNFTKDKRVGKIPSPFDVGMDPGIANNILSVKYDRYKAHTCGGYQGDVLTFLHDVQADPEDCKMLCGYEFGPIEGAYGGHHAVVVYPNGTDWKKTGTVFDPWPTQYPRTYTIARWEKMFSPINGDTSAAYRQKYPTTKSLDDYGGLTWRMPEHLYEIVIGALFCPVDLLITDEQGRRMGVLDNGSMVYEIPYSFLLKVPNEEGEGEYQWYFVLDPEASDTYSFEITGTEEGTFEFLTSYAEDNTFHYYGENQIKKDEKAEAVIDIDELVEHLTLPNGTKIEPEVYEPIIESSSSDDLKINTIRPITVMVTVIIVGFVMAFSRMKRRKP
jgi:hypothetical protein